MVLKRAIRSQIQTRLSDRLGGWFRSTSDASESVGQWARFIGRSREEQTILYRVNPQKELRLRVNCQTRKRNE